MYGRSVSTTFLKVVMLLVTVGVFVLWVRLPGLAMKDAQLHPSTSYFLIPFLMCAYGCSIAFTVALYQCYKLVTYIEKEKVFVAHTFRSLQIVKRCAFVVVCFILVGMVNLKILSTTTGDDSAGPMALGIMGMLGIAVIIAIVDVLQKSVQSNNHE